MHAIKAIEVLLQNEIGEWKNDVVLTLSLIT
jgi:hypothetical protein